MKKRDQRLKKLERSMMINIRLPRTFFWTIPDPDEGDQRIHTLGFGKHIWKIKEGESERDFQSRAMKEAGAELDLTELPTKELTPPKLYCFAVNEEVCYENARKEN